MQSAPRPEPAPAPTSGEDRGAPADLRGAQTTAHDRSAHRRHAWLYEDLLA